MNVLIDDVPFEIVIEGDGDHVYLDRNGLSVYGLCEYHEQTIYLHCNLANEMLRRVLVHEITHAFVYLRALYNAKWNEEMIADFMGSVLDDIYKATNEVMRKIGGVPC